MNKNKELGGVAGGKYLKISAIVGLIGVFLVAVGEFLMLYSPNRDYGISNGHMNFLHHDMEIIILGFFMAVLSAPIYILVYHHIALMLNASKRLMLSIISLASVGFVIGNVWLATNAYIAFVVHQAAKGIPMGDMMIFLDSMSNPLLQVVRVVVLSLSVIIFYEIWKGKTNYPKWMVIFSPFLLIIYIFVLFFFNTLVGNYLLPAALNIAHVIFMSISTYYASKIK